MKIAYLLTITLTYLFFSTSVAADKTNITLVYLGTQSNETSHSSDRDNQENCNKAFGNDKGIEGLSFNVNMDDVKSSSAGQPMISANRSSTLQFVKQTTHKMMSEGISGEYAYYIKGHKEKSVYLKTKTHQYYVKFFSIQARVEPSSQWGEFRGNIQLQRKAATHQGKLPICQIFIREANDNAH